MYASKDVKQCLCVCFLLKSFLQDMYLEIILYIALINFKKTFAIYLNYSPVSKFANSFILYLPFFSVGAIIVGMKFCAVYHAHIVQYHLFLFMLLLCGDRYYFSLEYHDKLSGSYHFAF